MVPGLRERPPEAEEERGFGFRAIQSLTIPAYRMYFLFVLGQMGAMNMQMIARSWFVFELTDSVTLLGTVALANAVPMIALSLFGGVLADRLPKKQVLIVGQFASTVITLGVAVSITVGSVTWVHLIVASFLQGHRNGDDDAGAAGHHPGARGREDDHKRGGLERRGDESAATHGSGPGRFTHRPVGHRGRLLHRWRFCTARACSS